LSEFYFSGSFDNIRLYNLDDSPIDLGGRSRPNTPTAAMGRGDDTGKELSTPSVPFVIIPGHHGGVISSICKPTPNIFLFCF